jgi:hypothetical protein
MITKEKYPMQVLFFRDHEISDRVIGHIWSPRQQRAGEAAGRTA